MQQATHRTASLAQNAPCTPRTRINMVRQYAILALALFISTSTSVAWSQRAEPFGSPNQHRAAAISSAVPRNFPAHAKRGRIKFLNAKEVKVNGRRSRLSPSSRIMDPRNMRLHAHILQGKNFHVMYTQDTMHQVADVWILSKLEMQRPSMQVQREQFLRSQGVNPKMFDIDPLTPYHKLPRYYDR